MTSINCVAYFQPRTLLPLVRFDKQGAASIIHCIRIHLLLTTNLIQQLLLKTEHLHENLEFSSKF